ncbi:Trp biosynthesis-associated membrane protein [Curtobacterium sp. MCBA15_012]|uniref:Trp biosynthesis-associated membrane protein n=1 Tax=Curtobacterium sp. MCBA15_012 TaxID=1898738 RepID=UPI0008DCA27E|nr:Trp biosynthesis-associated membrane protein [Curtobacterium sp. MCBA15_012]WIA98723.1 Trp biosynthesis-associated membrane protein [Curtobacterium sp. MCBA15_012]
MSRTRSLTRARSRPLVVVGGLAVAGIVMLSWTQTWFTVRLHTGTAVVSQVVADGAAAVPQYTALAIASLALFLALTIAGRVLRVVLGVVEVLLGAGVVLTGASALTDPVAASKGAVGGVAGVSDIDAVRRVVASVDVTVWPAVGIVGGVLAVLLGVAVLVLQRSWPGPTRKYGAQTTGAAAAARAAAPAQRDAITDWDDLSAGDDPTVLDGAQGGAVGEPTTTGAVGSQGRRSDDDAGTERGAP